MAFDRISPLGPVPDGWTIQPLKNIALKIGSGATPRGGEAVYLPHRKTFAFVRSQNVLDYHFEAEDVRYISNEHARELKGVHLQAGDLLLNITGDGVTFGRCCLVPDSILPAAVNQHVSIIRVDPSRCRPGYLLAYLCHPRIKEYIESFNAGGSRRAITKGHIESFLIALPKLEVQQQIEATVTTVLDKIAHNQHLSHSLEQMAQAIFQAWFVDYLPVRAKVAARAEHRDLLRPAIGALSGLSDTALGALPRERYEQLAAVAVHFPDELMETDVGAVPRGWEIVPLGDLLELAYGKALPKETRHAGAVPVYGSGGIGGWHNKHLVAGPGIVVGRKGTVGSVFWINKDFYPIDTVFYVKLRRAVPLYWIYEQLRRIDITSLGADSAVPGVNRNAVYAQQVLVPNEECLAYYEDMVQPLVRMLEVQADQANTLMSLRDALLPKILAGELEIPVAEPAV